MPFLAPHFDPDVFVSYSHGDPLGGRAPLRDWTRALVRRLNDRLHALETEFDGLDIWMDPEIDPTAYLTPELRLKASACGVLMIVMSKRYLKSSWCGDEREWFQKQFEGRVGDVGRLFVIRAQETDVNLWPDFLRDERGHAIPGFIFHDPEDGTPLSFELREPNDDYFKALGRLQTWLVKRLRAIGVDLSQSGRVVPEQFFPRAGPPRAQREFAEFARLEGRAGDVERIGDIAGQFKARSATLASVAASLSGVQGKSVCVLIDQFEELFRFEKEIGRDGQSINPISTPS
jgi:hypothetical protein